MKTTHIFLFLLWILAACSKDSQPTKTELLAKNWQTDEVQTNILGFKGTIYKKGATSNFEDFSKVRFNFRKDGTMDIISLDGSKATSVWKFVQNETQIEILNPTSGNLILKIINLSSTNFDFEGQIPADGQNIDATFKMIPE